MKPRKPAGIGFLPEFFGLKNANKNIKKCLGNFLRKNAKALFLADPSLECFVSANKRRARGEGGGETVGVLASEKE